MNLIGHGQAVGIDYLPYIPPMQLENVISAVSNQNELEEAKQLILSHYFSLQKNNRNLAKMISVKSPGKTRNNIVSESITSNEGFNRSPKAAEMDPASR